MSPTTPSSRFLVRLCSMALSCFGLLATPGCGRAGPGDGEIDEGSGGLPPVPPRIESTILRVVNAADSAESVVAVRAVSSGLPEAVIDVEVAPGETLDLVDLVAPSFYWICVEFASGFRTVPRLAGIWPGAPVVLEVAHLLTGPAALEATWTGAYQDAIGTLHTLSMTFDPAGQVTRVLVDALDVAKTGTTTETSEGVFRVTFMDASVALLVCDAANRWYAGIVFDDGAFGALQKGALPMFLPFTSWDAVGAWDGFHASLSTSSLGVQDLRAASAFVYKPLGRWTGHDESMKDFDGTTLVVAAASFGMAFGMLSCSYLDDTAVAGELTVFLSTDRSFAFGAYVPAGGVVFPEDLTFLALRRSFYEEPAEGGSEYFFGHY
jgi:hypothetical protein